MPVSVGCRVGRFLSRSKIPSSYLASDTREKTKLFRVRAGVTDGVSLMIVAGKVKGKLDGNRATENCQSLKGGVKPGMKRRLAPGCPRSRRRTCEEHVDRGRVDRCRMNNDIPFLCSDKVWSSCREGGTILIVGAVVACARALACPWSNVEFWICFSWEGLWFGVDVFSGP